MAEQLVFGRADFDAPALDCENAGSPPVTFERLARGLYVTGAGDVAIITPSGRTVTWTVPANFYIKAMCTGLASGTTATGIIILY